MMPSTEQEYEDRRQASRVREHEDFGSDAGVLSGPPELDVHNRIIDALLDLARGAEMLAARAEMMDKLFEGDTRRRTIATIREQKALALELADRTRVTAMRLIAIRRRLIDAGLHLGIVE